MAGVSLDLQIGRFRKLLQGGRHHGGSPFSQLDNVTTSPPLTNPALQPTPTPTLSIPTLNLQWAGQAKALYISFFILSPGTLILAALLIFLCWKYKRIIAQGQRPARRRPTQPLATSITPKRFTLIPVPGGDCSTAGCKAETLVVYANGKVCRMVLGVQVYEEPPPRSQPLSGTADPRTSTDQPASSDTHRGTLAATFASGSLAGTSREDGRQDKHYQPTEQDGPFEGAGAPGAVPSEPKSGGSSASAPQTAVGDGVAIRPGNETGDVQVEEDGRAGDKGRGGEHVLAGGLRDQAGEHADGEVAVTGVEGLSAEGHEDQYADGRKEVEANEQRGGSWGGWWQRHLWWQLDSGERDVCAICLNEYLAGEAVLELTCGHVFHKVCTETWFDKELNCPMCKATPTMEELDPETGLEAYDEETRRKVEAALSEQ